MWYTFFGIRCGREEEKLWRCNYPRDLPYERVNNNGIYRSCQNKSQDSEIAAVTGSVVTISHTDPVEEFPLLPQQGEGK